MLKSIIREGGKVKACGNCSLARGLKDLKLVDGVDISNMKEFAQWSIKADRVITF
jgi:sulfur relay (sulfurtransferase) complex TusBCD TusD component (DsrE family)